MMGRYDPMLWRIAMRLQAADPAARDDLPSALPEHAWQDCRAALSRLETAATRGWNGAAKRMKATAKTELHGLQRRLHELSLRLEPPSTPMVPDVRFLYDELMAVAEEFEEFHYEDSTLSVTTEPITLRGIELGPFSISLRTDRLGSNGAFTVSALEPNPAASCSSTTHPHVHDERLCAGDGKAAIAAALREGRFFDFFTIVDRILHTYAEGAAYVELKDWAGIACHDCDAVIKPERSFTCQACEETLCNDCLVCCEHCNAGSCSGCSECCSRCDYHYCEDCLKTCARCRARVCEACCEGRLCDACVEELQDEQEPEDENETTNEDSPEAAEPAESPLQSDGVGEAALSARPR